MERVDLSIQYHLATDASKWYLKNILFQLVDASSRTDVTYSYKQNLFIIIFIFF